LEALAKGCVEFGISPEGLPQTEKYISDDRFSKLLP
jgi:hypothetical protein